MKILIKNVLEPREKQDGFRVMVDENLPSGIDEYKAQIDIWPKEIGPSNRVSNILRDNPRKWMEYCSEYTRELEEEKVLWVDMILEKARVGTVTLLFSTGSPEHNNAVVIRDYILASREEFLLKAA